MLGYEGWRQVVEMLATGEKLKSLANNFKGEFDDFAWLNIFSCMLLYQIATL